MKYNSFYKAHHKFPLRYSGVNSISLHQSSILNSGVWPRTCTINPHLDMRVTRSHQPEFNKTDNASFKLSTLASALRQESNFQSILQQDKLYFFIFSLPPFLTHMFNIVLLYYLSSCLSAINYIIFMSLLPPRPTLLLPQGDNSNPIFNKQRYPYFELQEVQCLCFGRLLLHQRLELKYLPVIPLSLLNEQKILMVIK